MAAFAKSDASGGRATLSYPRTLKQVVDEADALYLARLYDDDLRHRNDNIYFKLWDHVHRTRDGAAVRIVQRIASRIKAHFGQDFEIVNDFYSYRAPETAMFTRVHQDAMFWSTDGFDGFNLWLMLDAVDLWHSFDVFEIERNPDLYQGIEFDGCPWQQRKQWAPRVKHATATRIALERGEALVLKQPEVHRTDNTPLQPHQWRLALGFKVMRRGKVARMYEKSPFATDAIFQRIQSDPDLPTWAIGENFPLLYQY